MSTKTKKPRTPKMSKSAARAEGATETDRLRKAALAEIRTIFSNFRVSALFTQSTLCNNKSS